MKRMVSRIVDEDVRFENAVLAMMVYSLPRNFEDMEAISLFPGMGESTRIDQTIAIWNENTNLKYLFIAGSYEGERLYEKVTINMLASLKNPPRNLHQVIIQEKAIHTKDQTTWLLEQAKFHGVQRFGLIVPPYHLMRAYCTLVKSVINDDHYKPAIFPIPLIMSPATKTPETEIDGWHMAYGEFERIERYRNIGDVATYQEARKYIDWVSLLSAP
jgi:hypothetical protein